MRRAKVFSIICIAVCAFCLFTAISASADVEWLHSGEAVTSKLSTSTEGEFELTDSVFSISVLCSGIFDGSVGTDGGAEITTALTLSGETVGSKSGETALLCTPTKGCEGATSEVWVGNLPWLGQAGSTPEESAFDYLTESTSGQEPKLTVRCKVLSTEISEECSGILIGALTNASETVSSEFNPGSSITGEKSDCTTGGEDAGELKGTLSTKLQGGGALQAQVVPSLIQLVGAASPNFGKASVGNKESITLKLEIESAKDNIDYEGKVLKKIGGFKLGAKDTCNGEIAAKAKCEIEATFAPKAQGKFGAILEIQYEDKTTGLKRLKPFLLTGEGTK
jgi:hypothetical protein